MEKKIEKYINENNLIYSICDGEDIQLDYDLASKNTPFVEKDMEKRLSPKLILKDCKSIIVIGKSYKYRENFKKDDKIRGSLSLGTIGKDYHYVLRNHLKDIDNIIRNNRDNNYSSYIHVDTGPLMERDIGVKSGLGFLGKNGLVINEKLGSFFYIGLLLINIELEETKSKEIKNKICDNCNLCIKNCPHGALEENNFNPDKCISYITQKRNINEKEMEMIGNNIYGCDICQNICPYNIKARYGSISINNIEDKYPLLEEFVNLNRKEFEEKYGDMAGYWRGRNLLVRNGIIGIGNTGNKDGLKILENFKTESEEVNKALKYSLKKLE